MMEYRATRAFPAEYGVLGLLLDGPAHGYDVQQRLHDGLGPVWRIAWSQLYSVLHGLEERGWIRATDGGSTGGPPRHTYAITPRGRRAFYEWAAAPVTRVRDVRVEFLAKLYFLRRHRPEELEPLIEREAEALTQALDRLEGSAASGGDSWMASVAASYRRRQAQSALDWLAEVRELLGKEERDFA